MEGNGNVAIGPDYKIDPDLTDRGNREGIPPPSSRKTC
jgi:hypothetical protein